MTKNKFLFFIFFFTTIIYGKSISVDNNISQYELLSQSEIYIDNTKSLSFEEIDTMSIEFQSIDKTQLSFGYSPDFNVWIKFTLENRTNKDLFKILEYENSMTTHITLFDTQTNEVFKDGLFQINKNRKTVNPIFELRLKPYESKTYYLKISSYITTMIIKLNLWEVHSFYREELKHQSILELFFGAMFILAVYNLFVYFFTKDKSYLFYVLYIFGVISHHLMYVGIGYIYLLKPSWIEYIIHLSSFIVALPIFALAFFTKSFISLRQYPKLNKILEIYLWIFPFLVSLFVLTDFLNKYRNIFTVILLLYLVFLAIYASLKKNRQAYFILVGWLIILIGGMSMYLSSTGVLNIYKHYPYIVETAFILEATLFAIALADKINRLQKEKENINQRFIAQQESEKERLTLEVKNKTRDLQEALNKQTILLKELNHRVKNNMQTIISLLRLQADEVDDEQIEGIFITIQNRINAMSHLHELLYKQADITHINAHEYFASVIDGLQNSYENEIDIYYDIQVELDVEQAISCGLILNELVVNSFKYAFEDEADNGIINIELYKEKDIFYFNISDNGKGYNPTTSSHSFGLTLVNNLVTNHLKGIIQIDTNKGVKTQIKWKDNG